MTTATLSLPEARDQVADISRMLTSFTTELIYDAMRGKAPQMTEELYIDAVKLLRATDRLLFGLRKEHHDPDTDWANIGASAQAVRTTVYLEIIRFKPDQASYWSEEAQAHAGNVDRGVDPSRILPILTEAEIAAAYAEMASDEEYEREALEWSEGLIGETLE